MTDLEGAVEHIQSRITDASGHYDPDGLGPLVDGLPVLALSTILDALASITRERDAMREGLKPFAELADWYASQEDDSFEVWRDYPHGGPRNLLRLGNFRRAAALVNGEGE